jgi:transcription elongation factor Elf1
MICKVCGRHFKPTPDKRYEVITHPVGLNVLTEKPKRYECFDCPKCGCQNIVNIREGGEVLGDGSGD